MFRFAVIFSLALIGKCFQWKKQEFPEFYEVSVSSVKFPLFFFWSRSFSEFPNC